MATTTIRTPSSVAVVTRNLFGPALKGRKARFIGDPDVPLTPTFVEDFASGFVVLGEREEALGEAWHVPRPSPPPGVALYARSSRSAARTPGSVGSRSAKALGLLWPLAREGAEMVYQFEGPFVVDSGKYARAFGDGEATPYREGIARTVEWYRRNLGTETARKTRTRTIPQG